MIAYSQADFRYENDGEFLFLLMERQSSLVGHVCAQVKISFEISLDSDEILR
jgi:hypothetical protein